MINNYYVYMHTAPNNKSYIGITKQKPKRRWRPNGSGYKNNKYFTKAIMKYGWDNFKHEILFYGLSQKQAEQKEIELIAKYKTSDYKYGYNLDNGGRTVGTLREETKEKLRKANLGKHPSPKAIENMSIAQKRIRQYEKERGITRKCPIGLKGENNPFYGKHHSKETKDKIRQKNSGINSIWWKRKHTQKEIEKISNAHKKQVQQIKNNIVIAIYPSVVDAAKKLNVKPNGIYQSIHRKTKSHNYYWKYKED